VFHGQLISKGLRPPRSPNLSPRDFFLWESFKNTVYSNHSHTLEELHVNTQHAVEDISNEPLRSAYNLIICVHLCAKHNGQHTEQFLQFTDKRVFYIGCVSF
jgi:hypothetical protein